MLLQIRHLGTTEDNHRFYHVQTHTGMSAIVDLYTHRDRDLDICLSLVGTYYRRDYPVMAPVGQEAPRIRDLEDGYQTVSSFLQTWEHSTQEQRDQLCEWDVPTIKYWRKDKETWKDVRTKTKVRQVEDRPRVVPARRDGDVYRAMVKDLRAALKGTTGAQNIRILGVTVKRSILDELLRSAENKSRKWILDQDPFKGPSALARDPILELTSTDGALTLRSADGRARVTVKHGAGDKFKGRHGWSRRIVLQAAS